jgi:S1-C subfamily serine protease
MLTFFNISLVLCSLFGLSCGNARPESYLATAVGPSVVKVTKPGQPRGGGTGFAVRGASGTSYIVTNAHVCDHTRDVNGNVEVWPTIKHPGQSRKLRVLEIRWGKTDLCVIEGFSTLEPLELGSEFNTEELLYAVGHPKMEPLTVTSGIARSRELIQIPYDTLDSDAVNGTVIPMGFMSELCIREVDGWDSTIITYPGNSGSPVVNQWGEVKGVIFASYNETKHGMFVTLEALVALLAIY